MTALATRARALVLLAPFTVAAGASLTGAQLFACTSFSDDGNGQADAASQTDGGDAELDAARIAPDAGDSGDAEAGRFCATAPALGLCADFDGVNEPVSFHFVEGVGGPELDTSLFFSPPASMKVRSTINPAFVRGQVSSPVFALRQRLSYDTYQGPADHDAATVPPDAILSSLNQGSDACTFDLETFSDKARFNLAIPDGDGGRVYQNFAMSAYPPPGRWSHVDVLLEKAAGDPVVMVTVRIDDVVALVRTATQCQSLSATPMVIVGLVGTGSSVPLVGEASFDNVLLDAK